jgi:hypothetical protein
MYSCTVFKVLCLTSVIFSGMYAEASPFDVTLLEKGARRNLSKFIVEGDTSNVPQKIEFRGRIPQCNRAEVTLTEAFDPKIHATFTTENGVVEDTTRVVHYNGAMKCGEIARYFLAAGTLTMNGDHRKFELLVPFSRSQNRKSRTLSLRLNKQGITKRLKGRYSKRYASRAHLDDLVDSNLADHNYKVSSATTLQADSTYELELAVDGDSGYNALHGSDANARIASVVNGISQRYESQIGVKVKLVRSNVWTTKDPYTATDLEGTLNQFIDYGNKNKHLGAADLYHLIVSEGITQGSWDGVAKGSVVCKDITESYGLSRSAAATGSAINSNEMGVPTHEIGHNLGQPHVVSQTCVMAPSHSNGVPTKFCDQEVKTLLSYISQNNSCLTATSSDPKTPSDPQPQPQPTSAAPQPPTTMTPPVKPTRPTRPMEPPRSPGSPMPTQVPGSGTNNQSKSCSSVTVNGVTHKKCTTGGKGEKIESCISVINGEVSYECKKPTVPQTDPKAGGVKVGSKEWMDKILNSKLSTALTGPSGTLETFEDVLDLDVKSLVKEKVQNIIDGLESGGDFDVTVFLPDLKAKISELLLTLDASLSELMTKMRDKTVSRSEKAEVKEQARELRGVRQKTSRTASYTKQGMAQIKKAEDQVSR